MAKKYQSEAAGKVNHVKFLDLQLTTRKAKSFEDDTTAKEEQLAKKRLSHEYQSEELEELRNTISKISPPGTNSLISAPFSEEDVIETLPEDQPGEAIARNTNHNGNNSNGVLSKESSPDLEVVTGKMILQSMSPTFIKETVSRLPKSTTSSSTTTKESSTTSPTKTPPKTLPKPSWFSLKNGENPANSALSSPGRYSRSSTMPKLSNGRPLNYENLVKEVREFEENSKHILDKMDAEMAKLDSTTELAKGDLGLQEELLAMETKHVKTEIDTLISR